MDLFLNILLLSMDAQLASGLFVPFKLILIIVFNLVKAYTYLDWTQDRINQGRTKKKYKLNLI